MNKRELSRIPLRMASDDDLSLAERTEGHATFFHARYEREADMLTLSIYNDRELRDGERTPYACVYLGRGDYITRVCTVPGKLIWLTGRLETIAYVHRKDMAIFLDGESVRALSAFYGMDHATLQNIHQHQWRVIQARLAARHRATKDRIDRQMALIPELPDDFDDFIHRALKNRYMFYTYKDRKVIPGYCTECRKEVMIPRPKHNQVIQCPACGVSATAKARGKYQHPLYDTGRICLPQQTAEGFALRYFQVQRREYTCGRTEFHKREDIRAMFGKEAKGYEYGRFKNTGEVRWCDPINSGYWYLDGDAVYPSDLKRLTADTKWRYAYADSLHSFAARNPKSSLHKYFLTYEEYPFIEYFIKVGLFSLAEHLMNRKPTQRMILNLHGRRLHEILRVKRTSLPTLIELDAKSDDVELVRALEDGGISFDSALVKEISAQMGHLSVDFAVWVLQYQSVRKSLLYAKKVQAQQWIDYMRMASEIGYSLRDERIAFPRDLKKAHDDVTAIHRVVKDEREREAFAKLVERLKTYRWTPKDSDYLITTPESADDLYNEGKVLDHCVHSYIGRIVRGESVIAFLRKKSDPATPYVTVEIRRHCIAQARGFKNHNPDKQTQAFVDQYGAHLEQCPDWKTHKAA